MPHIELVNAIVPTSTVARNIGVFFDDALSMESHVQHVCHVAYYHSTGRIRHLLNRKTTEMMVHGYVISRLDNGNGLLWGPAQQALYSRQEHSHTQRRNKMLYYLYYYYYSKNM